MQVLFVNVTIRKAQQGLPLHGLAPIVDPSDEIIEVLLEALRWDMQHRRFGLQWDWKSFMPYQWNCLTCLRKTCQTKRAVSKVGISKKHIVFFIRYAISCSWVGPRSLATYHYYIFFFTTKCNTTITIITFPQL
jgi:hypothetical protein